MKVATSLANQNPFIDGIEGEPCPTFGTMKLTLKNCPGLMEKSIPTQFPGQNTVL
jgi:hypothetical protein